MVRIEHDSPSSANSAISAVKSFEFCDEIRGEELFQPLRRMARESV
jgi:hypothetical protein